MNAEHLVAQGNDFREQNLPQQALACYAQAFVQDPENFSAWNNYGNVLRETGHPERSIPFLQHALVLEPNNSTAKFNLAVSYLTIGDYQRGWQQYEERWNFEHLSGTLPAFQQSRWTGQDLKDKTILIVGEQGHGDNIQFLRFAFDLKQMGANILLQVTDGLIPLLQNSSVLTWVGGYADSVPEFDYWTPIMSIPGLLGITVDKIPQHLSYLGAHQTYIDHWLKTLGKKQRMRVGLCWSGRRDTWLNRHKSMPFDQVIQLVQQNPDYEWINLQIDATDKESQQLINLGVRTFPGTINNFHDTAGLIHHMDVVVGVDTAVSHLSAAMGRPTWIMLNQFATCWRWLLKRGDSPWYPSARLFRQPTQGDWTSVVRDVSKWLTLFKV